MVIGMPASHSGDTDVPCEVLEKGRSGIRQLEIGQYHRVGNGEPGARAREYVSCRVDDASIASFDHPVGVTRSH